MKPSICEEWQEVGCGACLEGEHEDVGEDEEDEEEPGPVAADQAHFQGHRAQQRHKHSLADGEDVVGGAHAVGGGGVVWDEEADRRIHRRHQHAVFPKRQRRQARPRVVCLHHPQDKVILACNITRVWVCTVLG